MRDDRKDAVEPTTWDDHRLIQLVSGEILRDADAPSWDNDAFLRWLGEREGESEPQARRLSDDELRARGDAFMAVVEARRLAVRRRAEAAPRRRASTSAPPRAALRLAAAERATPLVDLGVAAGAGRELWDAPVSEWVPLPEEIPGGQHLALRIVGDSMEPIMHTGDVVLVRLGDQPKVNTVVIVRHPEDGYVCKKVRRLRRDRIELESLKPGRPSFTIPRDPELMVGTVLLVWCEHETGAGARV